MSSILFIIDKIELKYFEFNKLVTNFWLIKEFLDRGNDVYITTNPHLYLKNNIAHTKCYKSYSTDNNIFYKNILEDKIIDEFDLVLFRPDPPVDIDYINATYVLDFSSTKIINSPQAIRNFNEKLHSLMFKDYMTECLVSSSLGDIEQFLNIHSEIVLKPLNKCFGAGVMYLRKGDINTRTIINTVTNNETTLAMIQEYIPEVRNGDTRILTLGEEILPYCIKKLPGKDDFKFNTHNDKFLMKSELEERDLEYFKPIAKKLNSMGIVTAGLDVIDQKVIEINITSPCYFIKEINNVYGIELEKNLCDKLLTPALLTL